MNRNNILFAEGDHCNGLFYLVKGEAQYRKNYYSQNNNNNDFHKPSHGQDIQEID